MGNYHTLGVDLFELWLAAIIFAVIWLFGAALSIQDKETTLSFYIGEGVILGGAVLVTIGLIVGFIGVW